jgi:hypothetical protein
VKLHKVVPEGFNGGTTWSANSQNPMLAMGTTYCAGTRWYLRVSNAPADSSLHLLGVSNGVPWRVSNWRTIEWCSLINFVVNYRPTRVLEKAAIFVCSRHEIVL